MLLRSVTFENFGIYGGVHTFDLTPDTAGQFDRPVVLFSGKNGVGKTTFVEGVRLCLHGPVALASRVGQQEYAIWLEQHIHRAAAHHTAAPAAPTAVELSFDFTAAGKRVDYRVRRQWAVANGRLQVELWVWENGAPLTALAPEEREALLREVAPPGLADIFFFDGEKIFALAKDTAEQSLLVETVNALLGLNLVDQLQRDLDLYLARHGADGTRNGAHHELERALQEQGALASSQADLESQVQACKAQRDALHRQITSQEGRAASQPRAARTPAAAATCWPRVRAWTPRLTRCAARQRSGRAGCCPLPSPPRCSTRCAPGWRWSAPTTPRKRRANCWRARNR